METGKSSIIAGDEHTAKAMGSGDLAVFATPALVALMEEAALKAIEGMVQEGSTTVGTKISVEHLAATPVGMKVWAKATLTAREGRRFFFTIEAFDDKGLIGTATHERVTVFTAPFMEKTLARKEG